MFVDGLTGSIGKQPLRRVEIHLHKFNEVAIPHHIDLLMKHKNNMEKFQENGEWDRVHREQINATRSIKQLKALLYEMDMLRNQVCDSDLQKFDHLTATAQKSALKAIEDYLAMNPQRTSLSVSSEEKSENDNVQNNETHGINEVKASQLKLILGEEDVKKREECLKSWENLQAEVQDVHELFQDFAKVVEEQKEKVDSIEENIETTEENVTEGTNTLRKALKYKATMYPLAGALIGGCLGGPIGLIAGVKLGGLAALGCSVLGFTGGRFLKKKQEETNNEIEMLHVSHDQDTDSRVVSNTLNENVDILTR